MDGNNNEFKVLNKKDFEEIMVETNELIVSVQKLNKVTHSLIDEVKNSEIVGGDPIDSKSFKKIIQNQNKSLEFSEENSEQIENLTHSLKIIQESISSNNSESSKNINTNRDAKIGIEKSKLQLNQAIKSLSEISIVIQKSALEINSITPNVDISKIQSKINKTIKDSIKFKELDEMLDLYSGKISYFAEKTQEYDNSIMVLDTISKNINYVIPSITLFVGFSIGVVITLFLK